MAKKVSALRGCAQASIFVFSRSGRLSVVRFCLCVRRGLIDCETCTRPIYTNPEPTGARELTLTRGTCYVASRLELVTVAVPLRFRGPWCCVLRTRQDMLFFERTLPTACVREPCLSYPCASMSQGVDNGFIN